MHYEDEDYGLGFSFELPEGWRHAQGVLPPTFFGPNGQIDSDSEVIWILVGTILPRYIDAASREQFMAEPGATVSRTNLGDETIVVVLKKPNGSEITGVHDGIQYSIVHTHDTATLEAIDRLKATFKFPQRHQAIEIIRTYNEPHMKPLLKALQAESPEEARRELMEAGMPPTVERPGYTIHSVGTIASAPRQETSDTAKKWWEFWK